MNEVPAVFREAPEQAFNCLRRRVQHAAHEWTVPRGKDGTVTYWCRGEAYRGGWVQPLQEGGAA